MKLFTGKNAVLVLLILYCIDLAWKLAHWQALVGNLEWPMVALALTVRFAFMAGLLMLYLRISRRESSTTLPLKSSRSN